MLRTGPQIVEHAGEAEIGAAIRDESHVLGAAGGLEELDVETMPREDPGVGCRHIRQVVAR